MQLAVLVAKMQQVNDRLEALGGTSDSIHQLARIWEDSYDQACSSNNNETSGTKW
jgi:archaellum biogenesis protein FlaJ (TadC family)